MSESPSTVVKNEAVAGVNGTGEMASGKDHATGGTVIDVMTAAAFKAIEPALASAAAQYDQDMADLLRKAMLADAVTYRRLREEAKRLGLSPTATDEVRDTFKDAYKEAKGVHAEARRTEKHAAATAAAILPVERRHVLDLTPVEHDQELKRTKREAARLINCQDLLGEITSTLQKLGVAGDTNAGVLAYMCMATRVLKHPAGLVIKGSSSAGKSWCAKRACMMHPPEAVYEFDSGSPQALIYEPRRFENCIIYMPEAAALQRGDDKDDLPTIVRVLISEHRVRRVTVTKDPRTGELITTTREKEGPTQFTTTTTTYLSHELETRLITAFIPENAAQTRAVLNAAAAELDTVLPDLAEWHAFGRWLDLTAPAGVNVRKIAAALAKLTRVTGPTRIHRDFKAMLALMCVHALMCANFRKRDAKGRVIAEVADYEAILPLINASVAEASDSAVRPELKELVCVIRNRSTALWAASHPNLKRKPTDAELAEFPVRVTARELKNRLRCGLSSVSRRVADAVERGLLVNDETRRGRRMCLSLGDATIVDQWIFPSVARLKRELGSADLDDELEIALEDDATLEA